MAEYTDLLKQYMGLMPSPEKLKGLLQPQQTQLQAGLLGAAQALQPYMGYTTTPTTFGQAAVGALTGAAGGIQQKEQSDLARALQGLNVYSAIKDVTEKEKPLSGPGKLRFDYEQGSITEEEFNKGITDYYKTDDPATVQLIDYIAANRFDGKTDEAIDLLYSSKSESPEDWKRTYILKSMTSDFAPKPGDDVYFEYKQKIEQEAESLLKTLYPKKESKDQFTVGEKKEVNGIIYEYKGNDLWEPVE